jgi:type IV pilus assembly protein PilW
MTMSRNSTQSGFGLIEIMIGLAIAMIATVIMLQTFAVSESQKRTTTGASDAQSNGAISLFAVERDIKMAGWGIQGSSFAGCTDFFAAKSGAALDTNPTPGSSLVTVLNITEGGTQPDSITIQHYDDPSNQDYRFAIAAFTTPQATVDADFKVSSVKGCNVNDLVIIANGSRCTLAQVSAIDTAALTLSHASGGSFPYNPDAAYMTAHGWQVQTTSSSFQCIPKIYRRTYSIESTAHQLQLAQGDAGGAMQTFEIAPQIMDLQAEYGVEDVDAATLKPITTWVGATGDWANPDIAHIRRIKAARIAVLSRSATFEKPGPNETVADCKTTTTLAGLSKWATFHVDSVAFTDWKCYRYKAYEINVPLRNIVWSK